MAENVDTLEEYEWEDMKSKMNCHQDDDEDAYQSFYQDSYQDIDSYDSHHELFPSEYPNTHIPKSKPFTPSCTRANVPRSLQTLNPNGQQPSQDVAPPLLPAFLITGLLLGAIVLIIMWRHFVERRRITLRSGLGQGEDVWGGGGGLTDGDGMHMREKPRIWEAFTTLVDGGSHYGMKEEWRGWENVMPLSATPIFGHPKRQQPRYLIPSDRPTTFVTRMFGGGMEGFRSHSGRISNPLTSSIAYTNRQGANNVGMMGHELAKGVTAVDEERIEKVQLSFVVAMPSERSLGNGVKMKKRNPKDKGRKKEEEDEGEKWLGEVESDNLKKPKRVRSGELMIREGDRLPELCLGSLMIPYG